MSRSYTSIDLVSLPRTDAATTIALAASLDGAAEDQLKQGATLPDAVVDARTELAADSAALQIALGSAPAPNAVLRVADMREDTAAGALYYVCQAWSRLAGEIPEGDTARVLLHRLFADGLEFINYKSRKEWSVVDTKLKVIEDENLEPEFAKLGALPILAHLRNVHAHYGKVLGMTQPAAVIESPLVGEKRHALLDSIRHYVVAVNGSVRRKMPATQELATQLLKPLADWEAEARKPAPKNDG